MSRSTRILALTTIAAMSVSCSSPSGPGAVQNDLVFTRADQSTIPFSGAALLFLWCGPWEDGVVATPSLHVLFGGPGAGDATWQLRAVIADVMIGEPVGFPNSFVFDQPKDVDLFILDLPNELSTQNARSSGSITFEELSCESGGEVQFSIDAVVGSEFGDGLSVHVTGSFRGPIGQSPDGDA